MSKILHFRTARQAAEDDPADLLMARERWARHVPLPLSREAEVILAQIREHETEIARRAGQIRWLRLSLESV